MKLLLETSRAFYTKPIMIKVEGTKRKPIRPNLMIEEFEAYICDNITREVCFLKNM